LLARHAASGRIIPSFILQAVMMENGVSAESIEVEIGREIRVTEELAIPIDKAGKLVVFSGLREKIPRHSADILIWDSDEEASETSAVGLTKEERTALESRVVMIGFDDGKARRIPFRNDEAISEADVFATAMATIQSGRYIQRVRLVFQILVWAAIVGVGLFVLRGHRSRAMLFAFLLLIGFFVGGMIQFQMSQTWMPVTIPLGLIACVVLGGILLCAPKDEPEPEG